MKRDGYHCRVALKIDVCRQQRHSVSSSNGTEQEVSIGTLQSACATRVEEFGCVFVIGRRYLFVGKRAQVVPQPFEDTSIPDAAEHFLPDRTDDRRAAGDDEPSEFIDGGVPWRTSPKRQRPDRRVNEDFHRRRRCFL